MNASFPGQPLKAAIYAIVNSMGAAAGQPAEQAAPVRSPLVYSLSQREGEREGGVDSL